MAPSMRTACPLLALLTLMALTVPAAGHASLAASAPPPGGGLPADAGVLALAFTERVDPAGTWAAITDGQGDPVPAELEFPSFRRQDVRVLTDPLPAGAYTLRWQALGVDGHATSGVLRFGVGGEAAADDGAASPGAQPDAAAGAEALGRMLMLLALGALLGLPVFVGEVAGVRDLPRRAPLTLVAAAAAGLAGIAVQWSVLATVAVEGVAASTAGRFLLGKAALLALSGGLAAVAARSGPLRRGLVRVVSLPAFLGMVLHSMSGHGLLSVQAGEGVAGHIALTLHLLATGLWVGGLLGFLVLLPDRRREDAAVLVSRFSPLALLSVLVLGLTGLYQAYVHVPIGTGADHAYVRLLVVKTCMLVMLVAFGWFHLRWLGPRLADRRAQTGTLRRSLGGEATLLAAVVLVAGFLAAIPAPVDDRAAHAPLAVAEAEGVVGDYVARVAVHGDPVRHGQEHLVTVTLRPLSSRGLDEAAPGLALASPRGDVLSLPAPERVTSDTWSVDRVAFPAPGDWGVRVSAGGVSRDLAVRVLPAA